MLYVGLWTLLNGEKLVGCYGKIPLWYLKRNILPNACERHACRSLNLCIKKSWLEMPDTKIEKFTEFTHMECKE